MVKIIYPPVCLTGVKKKKKTASELQQLGVVAPPNLPGCLLFDTVGRPAGRASESRHASQTDSNEAGSYRVSCLLVLSAEQIK